ncbi:hypothetical protein ACOME3_008739 [Neoechinorhynchus agilis]
MYSRQPHTVSSDDDDDVYIYGITTAACCDATCVCSAATALLRTSACVFVWVGSSEFKVASSTPCSVAAAAKRHRSLPQSVIFLDVDQWVDGARAAELVTGCLGNQVEITHTLPYLIYLIGTCSSQ